MLHFVASAAAAAVVGCFCIFVSAQVPHRGGDRIHVSVKKFNQGVNDVIGRMTKTTGAGWHAIQSSINTTIVRILCAICCQASVRQLLAKQRRKHAKYRDLRVSFDPVCCTPPKAAEFLQARLIWWIYTYGYRSIGPTAIVFSTPIHLNLLTMLVHARVPVSKPLRLNDEAAGRA